MPQALGFLRQRRLRQTAGAIVLGLLLTLGTAARAAEQIELISKADPSPDTSGTSFFSSMSTDGRYVVFESDAPNLVPGQVDTNFFSDVFLRDRVAGTLTLISHASGNPNAASPVEGSFLSLDAQISADGRYVAFISLGTDLVSGVTDANHGSDVFLYDRVTGTTTLISHASGDPKTTANGATEGCRISADGNYVVFSSRATNLLPGQAAPPGGEERTNLFLYHRPSGSLNLISHTSGALSLAANGSSVGPEISADGGFVVFLSSATDLVSGQVDTNGSQDVFLYQRSSGTVSVVSRASDSAVKTAGRGSGDPHISADGRWIAFTSTASNLIAGQVVAFKLDAFLYDSVTGQMRLASHTATSPQTQAGIFPPFGGNIAMSADGRYVAFASQAANLVAGQVNLGTGPNIFVYDRITDKSSLVSHAPDSATTSPAGSDARRPSLSADGRYVAFESFAPLVPHQSGGPTAVNVFVYDQTSRTMVLASHVKGSLTEGANDSSSSAAISADGGVIVFSSFATDLGDGQIDPNHFSDLFLFDRKSAEVAALTQRDPDLPAAAPYGPNSVGGISADGRFVAFVSRANGLVPGQVDQPWGLGNSGQELGNWDVFLRDLTTGKTTLVSRSSAAPPTAMGGQDPALSADGQYLAFVVRPNSEGAIGPLNLYDRVADSLTLITHAPDSPTVAEGIPTDEPVLSADGRYVAHTCFHCRADASQPAPSQDPNTEVFLYDRLTGANTLVSHVPGSPTAPGNGRSEQPRMSADGRFVVFVSVATNLVAGQAGASSQNVFVFDRTSGMVSLVNHAAGSAATTASSFAESPDISADGRFIAFESSATDLVSGQAGHAVNVFLYATASGTNVLVSHAGSSPLASGNGDSHLSFFGPPALSADGRWVVFQSAATDLVPGVSDTNNAPDIFLYERISGTLSLISFAGGHPTVTANQSSHSAIISADGNRIAFQSAATGMVPGQSETASSDVNLFVQDRATAARNLVGRQYSANIGVITGNFLKPVMSGDGMRTLFTSDAALVPRDFNGNWDVYLFDSSGSIGPPSGPVFPCTVLDAPSLRSNVRQVFPVSGPCGLPATAKQVTIKVTVSAATGKGTVQLYPGNVTRKPPATLAFQRRQTKSATFTLPLATNGAGTLALLPTVANRGTVHVVVEVEGFSP
ncbi:MAG TPA: hypothetical protein VF173_35175 [Thermoanaerobaculia bacterium]|nr:hypothetical protein [Thermoanaerobaculia bacterium]